MDLIRADLRNPDIRKMYIKTSRIITASGYPNYGIMPMTWILDRHNIKATKSFNAKTIATHVHGVVAVMDTTGKDRTYSLRKADRDLFKEKTEIQLSPGNISGLVMDLDSPNLFEWSDEILELNVKEDDDEKEEEEEEDDEKEEEEVIEVEKTSEKKSPVKRTREEDADPDVKLTSQITNYIKKMRMTMETSSSEKIQELKEKNRELKRQLREMDEELKELNEFKQMIKKFKA